MARFCWRCGTRLPATPPTTCTGCGQVHYLNPAPCGEAVVVREGKVLLLRRAMDPYEPMLAAAAAVIAGAAAPLPDRTW